MRRNLIAALVAFPGLFGALSYAATSASVLGGNPMTNAVSSAAGSLVAVIVLELAGVKI